jgi:hypothetical protein
MTIEDFASNYRNKIMKDLSDQLTAASKVLVTEELLSGLTDDCRRVLLKAGMRGAIAENYAVSIDEYNKLVNQYNDLRASKRTVDAQLQRTSTELNASRDREEASQLKINEMKHKIETREQQLQRMKKDILDSATMGMLKRAVVEEKFNDYGV